jgi:hypothetical protein
MRHSSLHNRGGAIIWTSVCKNHSSDMTVPQNLRRKRAPISSRQRINIAERNAVVLTYQTRHGLATDWKSVNQRVNVTWTDCHFGGRRPWFICSMHSGGRRCGRRVAVLYGLRDYFACRHCYRLAYESQQEPIRMRGLIKAQKILTRLGAKPDVLDPFPEKPPRMHWRTYRLLYRTYAIAKDRSLQGILRRRPS